MSKGVNEEHKINGILRSKMIIDSSGIMGAMRVKPNVDHGAK